jgi:ribosomal protein L11 methyltransferase
LGTGTGVLALAAARLGARNILAVDLNHLAVKTTHANLSRNLLQRQVLAAQGRAEDFIDCEADLLIANIHFDVMKRLVAAPGFILKPWSILSGLLRSEARLITDQLNHQGASIVHSWEHEGIWHTFLVRAG